MNDRPTPDWSLGRYESTAAQLLPAAEAAIDVAAPRAGERVVDIGTGTGNAALLAAARGASTTGVDPAQRLLEVAAQQAQARGLNAEFVSGDAGHVPLPDASADLVLSVFGVIFAPSARAAIDEMARIAAPAARIVLTAWIPEGPISEAAAVCRSQVMKALGAPPGPPSFAWHNRDTLSEALEPHRFTIDLHERELAFTAKSPSAYIDNEFRTHPMWLSADRLLESTGEMPAIRERALAILEAGNEQPASFRATSRYVIAVATRSQPE